MIWVRKQTINPEVTDYYLETIGEAYKKAGEDVTYFYGWEEYRPQRGDITVVTRYKEVLRMILNRRPYVYWIQGLLPEENYAQRHSKLRVCIYEQIEKILFRNTLREPNFFIMVSERMKKHYEEKYGVKIENCCIMPCSNDVIYAQNFVQEKYDQDVFCYAGGLNSWQCIDETMKIYKTIEQKRKNTKLLLLIKDREKAMELLQKYDIQNYEIDFVPVEQLSERLKEVKYGFIIRDNLELNRVATPTKLMTYMGNGIIPILSECLEGLLESANDSEYVIKLRDNNDLEPIYEMMDQKISAEAVLADYRNVYQKHYDKQAYVEKMAQVLPR